MSLKFREDQDLFVLGLAAHKDLARLGDVLTLDGADGSKRRAQALLDDEQYKKALAKKDLTPVWRLIAAELQAWGGDSVANVVRSLFKDHRGVPYREIVCDLCDHLKLKVSSDANIMELEGRLLKELIRGQQDKFTAEQRRSILKEAARGVGMEDNIEKEFSFDELAKRGSSDPRFAYILAAAVPAIASATLPFLARLTATTALAIVAPRLGASLVPGAGLVAAASTLSLLTSPAYRVTLPAVLEVSRIRRYVVVTGQFGEEQVAA